MSARQLSAEDLAWLRASREASGVPADGVKDTAAVLRVVGLVKGSPAKRTETGSRARAS